MSEQDIIEELGNFAYDPYAFVMWAFPWGEENTELEHEPGPNEWQTWVLTSIRDNILTLEEALLIAVTSGHGVGKSALVAWIIWWAFSTYPDTRGVVTANTENQLKTKTWVEISKWGRLFLARHLFNLTATAIFPQDEDRAKTWRIDIVPWSERNTEAFAGLHNKGRRILIVFDEASAIPDIIWETTEGALTDHDTEILWCVFGNPTRNTGRFRECFEGGTFHHRWRTRKVDSREVPQTNKKQIDKWIKDYGEDSDFVRVRVLGEFPRVDANSFISRDLAVEAANRTLEVVDDSHIPIVLGVDVARFGDDFSVIYPRKGRDARSLPVGIFQGLGTMELSGEVIRFYEDLGASMIFVDEGGVGGGVVDRLQQLGYPVIPVSFGAKADGTNPRDPSVLYANKRAEIWGGLRDFLTDGAIHNTIPGSDISLVAELTTPTYTLDSKQRIVLEPKEAMKKRGERSPDVADALACTFAVPVPEVSALPQARTTADYNPLTEEKIYVLR